MLPRMNIYYHIEIDALTAGLHHVTYVDSETGEILGGWDTIGTWDEIESKVKENWDEIIKRLSVAST